MKIGNSIKPEYYFIACDYINIYFKRESLQIAFTLRLKMESTVRANDFKLSHLRSVIESNNYLI